MTDERKTQLSIGVDTTPARSGFKEIEQGARDMAQTVSTAGKQAASGLDGIGAGGNEAAAKLDRATSSMVQSVQRATAALQAGAKGSSGYFEALAGQRGVNQDVLRPYIEQLRQAEQGQRQLGVSAAQTAAAMRGVPAQLTDIVTSLQGGQAPLTVLLQQGGQLKDMFGGIAPAARALGGALLGLVNPYTIAAAAAGGLAVAYFKGAAEAEGFEQTLILTGRAAGVTTNQLMGMAASVSQVVGTQGAAAEVLTVLASSGRVARDQLEGATEASIALAKATGQSATEIAKGFADIGRGPTEAILKLNEQYRFLTASTFEQIKALEEQGRKEEAAALAQRTYESALKDRAKGVTENLGLLEKGWRGVAETAKEAWDAMLGVGRDQTLEDQIKQKEEDLARYRRAPGFNPGVNFRDEINRRSKEIGDLRTQMLTENAAAASAGARQAQEERAIRWAQEREKYLGKAAKLEADITRIRNEGAAAGATQAEIETRIAFVREQAADKGAARQASKQVKDAQAEIAKALGLVDDLSAKQDGFSANYGEQVALLSNAMRKGAISTQVYDAAMEKLLQRQPFAVEQTRALADAERQVEAERKRRYEEVERQYEQQVRSAEQAAKGVEDRVQAMAEEEQAIQRSIALNVSLAQALADVRIARLSSNRDEALRNGDQELADGLSREIGATRKAADLSDRKAQREAAGEAYKNLLKGDIGTDFAAGFDKASQSLGVFVEQFGKLGKLQEEYSKAKAADNLTDKQRASLDDAFFSKQVGGYASLAGAAKGFFKEQSNGYKALQAAEQVLRAVELASSAQRVAAKLVEGQAVAAVGVANQASGDPYSAPFRMAAMAATMAALGFAVAGSFGGGSDVLASNKGTGTVLGDPEAASESVSKAIDDLSDIDTMTMRYSAAMAASLKNIEGGIGGLASLLVQSGGLEASAAGIQEGFKRNAVGDLVAGRLGGVQIGSMIGGLLLGPIGIIGGSIVGALFNPLGKALGNLFGTKTKIVGQGLYGGPQSVGDILSDGFDASYFNDINTKKKAFGVSYSNKTKTKFSDADPLLERQISTIFGGFADALSASAGPLGRDLSTVEGAIRGFVVDIGRVDLKGLKGQELSDRLTNVFSAAGDKLAGAALGGLEAFQKVGEGYLQTVVRTASGVEMATVVLRQFGLEALDFGAIANKQGDVAAELVRDSLLAAEALGGVADILRTMDGDAGEIAQAYKGLRDVRETLQLLGLSASAIGFDLLQGSGGLDALADSLKSFEEGFLSESGQVDVQVQRMAKAFERLGLALPDSGESFSTLVRGIDTSTEAGRLLLGNVLQLAGGFSELLGAMQDVGAGIQSEIERIRGLTGGGSQTSVAQLQADFAIKTAQARSGDQSAIDALPRLSKALLDATQAQAASSLDVAVMQAAALASLEETLRLVTDPTARLGRLQGFASGGDFAGGWRLVGENGPEIEATGPARIFDSATTARILGGAGGGGEAVVAEVRALRQELAALRADQQVQAAQLAANTGRTVRILEAVTPDGNSIATTAG